MGNHQSRWVARKRFVEVLRKLDEREHELADASAEIERLNSLRAMETRWQLLWKESSDRSQLLWKESCDRQALIFAALCGALTTLGVLNEDACHPSSRALVLSVREALRAAHMIADPNGAATVGRDGRLDR
jgi:hypothetical protein